MKLSLRLCAGKLRRSEAGSVIAFFGLATSAVMASVGGAVDFARWYHAKTVTMSAIDSAVLAGARALQMGPGNAEAALDLARQIYLSNTSKRAPLASDTVTFVTADNDQAVTATGSALINTVVLKLVGINSLAIVDSSKASFPKAALAVGGGSNIEISLMLDITGSMCSDGNGPCTTSPKLDGLKSAAGKLIDVVLQPSSSSYYAKIALVPFSTRVRVGQDGGGAGMMKALTNLNATWTGWYNMCTAGSGSGGSEDGGNWTCTASATSHYSNWLVMPCVTDRYYDATGSMDTTDDAPGAGKWLNAHGGDRMVLSWDSSSTAPTDYLGLTSADPAYHWNYEEWGGCADVAQANEIMALSSDAGALKARVNGLEAYGATAGALGTSWAWYMLSPKWSGIFTGDSTPAPYSDITTQQANGAPKLRKVAVLVTDGVYNTWRGWKGQDQQAVSDYAKQICTNMKAQGIEIYTVGVSLDLLTPAERAIATDTLQSCGSDVQHFYDTLTIPQLETAFQQIASNLSGVRLSQ
jgi:Flp pilus assembly protein TadG